MIQIRKSGERGGFDFGWLKTKHTFSFGEYYDPENMGFRDLRVINEDVVEPGGGFPTHGHRDMEIVTYILDGALEHKDSMGNGSVISPGDVQRMSAGTGVRHSEFNASNDKPVHLLQIWILPKNHGDRPGYEQKNFGKDARKNRLALVASPDGRDGSVTLHQDASIYASVLEEGQLVTFEVKKGRGAWIQLTSGSIDVNGKTLTPGDGAAIENESPLTIKSTTGTSEFLLFDLN